jgi:hypothetical protein
MTSLNSIPDYPATRPLAITDRQLLDELFQAIRPTVSELCFANLFLFRRVHRYNLCRLDNCLLVSGCGYDGQPYFLPPLSGDRGLAAHRLLADGQTLYGIDEQFLAEHLAGGNYRISADRDNDDYLYRRSDLAELPGKAFHKKKNRINYFTARHEYTVEEFSVAHLAGAISLLNDWQRVHQLVASKSLAAEIDATREGLVLAAEIGLTGVTVLVGGSVAAFALGEMLNETTAVCHFEKAAPFLEGLAQLVNREFSRRLPPACIHINREQDLGESGLREAKLSYHPLALVNKFRVTT